MKSLLTLNNIEFHRRNFKLKIDQIELKAGQIYLLEGTNGSGKSTLLQLLALLQTPTVGTLSFNDEIITSEPQRERLRRQITLVDQNPYLFDTSVYKNLIFGLRMRGMRGDLHHHIDNALETFGLVGFENRHVRTLSGGEAQRVALARAMVLQTKLLLLDEPTTGLDRETLPFVEKCLALLSEQGTTLVIASHDNDQSRRLTGKVLTLNRGELLPIDPSATRPTDPTTMGTS